MNNIGPLSVKVVNKRFSRDCRSARFVKVIWKFAMIRFLAHCAFCFGYINFLTWYRLLYYQYTM